MKRHFVPGVLGVASAMLATGAVTTEELNQRLNRVEGKLATYEKRFGPLVPTGPGSPSSTGDADADVIDATFGLGGGVAADGGNWWERTTLGGYGEMHLNFVSGGANEIDFHRWVIFLNHRFNDKITLNSELELEHSLAGEGKNGEIELEQAYVDIDLGKGVHLKGGLFLLPVGILNETHEPETFFGVERNKIESEIIPTTWWEGGLAVSQSTESGFSWDLAVHSGLDLPTSGKNAYRIRSGRQKVSNAPAEEPAATARVRFTGVPGVDLSVFGNYQHDITQTPGSADNSAYLIGAAANIQRGGFGLRGVVGEWHIDGPMVRNAGRDVSQQWGFYVEPSYTHPIGEHSKIGVFGRWNRYDYAMGMVDQIDAGINFWPIDNVVFKADFSHIDKEGSPFEEVFNFGVGYSF